MYARAAIARCPIEAGARAKVVFIPVSRPAKKGFNNWIQLIRAADVFNIGIKLVAQAKIERQLWMHAPVILKEEGQVRVVGVGNYKRAIGRRAAEGDRKKQVVIVNASVSIVIEVGEVLNKLNAALLEDFEVEVSINALNIGAETKVVLSFHE